MILFPDSDPRLLHALSCWDLGPEHGPLGPGNTHTVRVTHGTRLTFEILDLKQLCFFVAVFRQSVEGS